VVVLGPETGDAVQTLKAGILEIADVFVVNKKDVAGAERVVHDIESMLSLKPTENRWTRPVLLTEARSGEGVEALWQAIERHHSELDRRGIEPNERLRRHLHELNEIVETRFTSETMARLQKDEDLKARLSKEARPNLYAMAEKILSDSARPTSRRK